MILGYLCLGGGQELEFWPDCRLVGQPIGPHRGRWKLEHTFQSTTLSIPSRDKQVQLLFSCDLSIFAPKIATIDSSEGRNYRTKLRVLLPDLGPGFVGVVNNLSADNHHSLAILTKTTPVHVYGLYDTNLKSTYLFWSDDPSRIEAVLQVYPLRFLLYRFPTLVNDVLFLPIERLCSQWWGWMRTSESGPLLPFNALERRLFGQGA